MKNTLSQDGDKPEKIADVYVRKVHSLFDNVRETRAESEDDSSKYGITFTNDKGSFTIWLGELTIGIAVEGADTGYWNTSEEENIDIYFWFAIGVLRHGIRYRKPLIGIHQAWIYSDENKSWAVVPKKYHAYGYTKFRDKFPGETEYSS